jgi:hypothetical protein
VFVPVLVLDDLHAGVLLVGAKPDVPEEKIHRRPRYAGPPVAVGGFERDVDLPLRKGNLRAKEGFKALVEQVEHAFPFS